MPCPYKGLGVPDDEGPADLVKGFVLEGFADDFGADARGVPQGDGKDGTAVSQSG